MRVLVAGGTGFVGTHLCRELAQRDHDVTALARSPEDASLPPAVDVVAGDVTVAASLASPIADADAVVNLVALSPLFKPKGGREIHDRVHRQGTANVLEAMADAGVDRLIQLSGLGASPDAPTAYLRAKGEAEALVRDAAVTETIFRPSIYFGDGGEFVPFTRLLTPPILAVMPGGGRTPFQPLWIDDGVELIAEALESDQHAGRSYDVGGPEVLRLADVARKARAAQGWPVRVIPLPMPLVKVGARIGEHIPYFPFGIDQYEALKLDNTVPDEDNAVLQAFGRTREQLRSLDDYLGLD